MSDDILTTLRMKMAMNQELIFYTSVLYGLELELGATKYNTAATDGMRIRFTESFLLSMPEEEQLGLLLHEVRHVTDLHQFRAAGRDLALWNEACDHVINLDITADGFKLPQLIDPNTGKPNICCDKKYKGMAAEEVYEKLVEAGKDAAPMTPDLSADPDKGEGDGNEEGDGAPQSGSMIDDSNEPSDPSEASGEDIQNEIKDLLIQAVEITQRTGDSTAAGKIPGNILRMVEAWLNPVVPWDTLLQKYMSQKCKEEYSWQRPSRRYMAQKLYIPSLHSEQLGNIHVFIDGSCSVSKKMFDMQVGQVKWIKHNLNPREIRIIVFNTRIVDEFIFSDQESIDVEFKAHGGTNVREVVEYMEKNKAECNIVMTDGYFHKHSLKDVKDDILCLIYDNDKFDWEGSTTIYLPPEIKTYESYAT